MSQNSRTLRFFERNHRIKAGRRQIRNSVHHEAKVAVMFLSLDMLVKGAQSFSQFKTMSLANANQAIFQLFLANHYRKHRKFISENGKNSTELVLQAVMKPGTDIVGGYYVYLYDTLVRRTVTKGKKEVEKEDNFALFIQRLIQDQDFDEHLGMSGEDDGKKGGKNPVNRKKGWEVMFSILGSTRQYASAIDKHFDELGPDLIGNVILGSKWDPMNVFTMARAVNMKQRMLGFGRDAQGVEYKTVEEELKEYDTFFIEGVRVLPNAPAVPEADQADAALAQNFMYYDNDDLEVEEAPVAQEQLLAREDGDVGQWRIDMPPDREAHNCFFLDPSLCHPLVLCNYYMPHRLPYTKSNSPLMRFYRQMFDDQVESETPKEAVFERFIALYGTPAQESMYMVFESFCAEATAEMTRDPGQEEKILAEFESIFNPSCDHLLSKPLAAHRIFMDTYLETHTNMHFPHIGAPPPPTIDDEPKPKNPTHRMDPFGHLMRWHMNMLENVLLFVNCHQYYVVCGQGTLIAMRGRDRLNPTVVGGGDHGSGKSYVLGEIAKDAVPGTADQVDHDSQLSGTANNDSRGFIVINDEGSATSIGASGMTSGIHALIQFCLGQLQVEATKDQELTKMRSTNNKNTSRHLALDPATGQRILIETITNKYGATFINMNLLQQEIPPPIQDRFVFVDCFIDLRRDRDITTAMRQKALNDRLTPDVRFKLEKSFREFNQLTHFKASMIYVFMKMGLIQSINQVAHGIVNDRLTQVLVDRFGIDARISRKTLKHLVFAEAGTIQRAIYLVDTLGIGGPDLGEPFHLRHILLYKPFLCIPIAVTLFEAELLNLFVDRSHCDVTEALQHFIARNAISTTRESEDKNFKAFAIFPPAVMGMEEQIKYLSQELRRELSGMGRNMSIRKVVAVVATLYTLYLTIPVGQPGAGSKIEGFRFKKEVQRQSQMQAQDGKMMARAPPLENNILMVNNLLLNSERTEDLVWRAALITFPPDTPIRSYVRGKFLRHGKYTTSVLDVTVGAELDGKTPARTAATAAPKGRKPLTSNLPARAAEMDMDMDVDEKKQSFHMDMETEEQKADKVKLGAIKSKLASLKEFDPEEDEYNDHIKQMDSLLSSGNKVRNPGYLSDSVLQRTFQDSISLFGVDTFDEAMNEVDISSVEELSPTIEDDCQRSYLKEIGIPDHQLDRHFAISSNLFLITDCIHQTSTYSLPFQRRMLEWKQRSLQWWALQGSEEADVKALNAIQLGALRASSASSSNSAPAVPPGPTTADFFDGLDNAYQFLTVLLSMFVVKHHHYAIKGCPSEGHMKVWLRRYNLPSVSLATLVYELCCVLLPRADCSTEDLRAKVALLGPGISAATPNHFEQATFKARIRTLITSRTNAWIVGPLMKEWKGQAFAPPTSHFPGAKKKQKQSMASAPVFVAPAPAPAPSGKREAAMDMDVDFAPPLRRKPVAVSKRAGFAAALPARAALFVNASFPLGEKPKEKKKKEEKTKEKEKKKPKGKRNRFVEDEAEAEDDEDDELAPNPVEEAKDQAFLAREDEDLGGESGPPPFSPSSDEEDAESHISEVSCPSPLSRAISMSTRDAYEAMDSINHSSSASTPTPLTPVSRKSKNKKASRIVDDDEYSNGDMHDTNVEAAAASTRDTDLQDEMVAMTISQQAGHADFSFLSRRLEAEKQSSQ